MNPWMIRLALLTVCGCWMQAVLMDWNLKSGSWKNQILRLLLWIPLSCLSALWLQAPFWGLSLPVCLFAAEFSGLLMIERVPWQKALAIGAADAGMAGLIAVLCMAGYGISLDSPAMLAVLSTALCGGFLMDSLICWSGRRKGLQRLGSGWPTVFFTLVPAVFCCMGGFLTGLLGRDEPLSLTIARVYFEVMACLWAALVLFQIDYRNKISRRSAGDLIRVVRRQKEHRQDLQERTRSLHAYRGECLADAASIEKTLLDADESQTSRLIDQAEAHLREIRAGRVCRIPAINAIVTAKQRVCQEKGIALKTEVALPDSLKIESLDVCIALTNLLDNAIRASMHLPAAERSIVLHMDRRARFIRISCENALNPDFADVREGTGYGQKILAELAGRYDGRFEKGLKEGNRIYRAVLLLNEEAAPD